MNNITWLMFALAIVGGTLIGIVTDKWLTQREFDLVFIYGVIMIAIAISVCIAQ